MQVNEINGVAFRQENGLVPGQDNVEKTKSDFLLLLTTQLQNQDPLSPMETAEFTQQLIGFSMVEEQINGNKRLDDLINLQQNSQTLSMVDYIGAGIEYLGNDFSYQGQAVPLSYELPQEATDLSLVIMDENNNLITNLQGPSIAGSHKLAWDGKDSEGNPVEPGDYRFLVAATDAEDQPITVATTVGGRVTGVESDDGQLLLMIGGRGVSINDLISVYDASAQDPEPNGEQEETLTEEALASTTPQ